MTDAQMDRALQRRYGRGLRAFLRSAGLRCDAFGAWEYAASGEALSEGELQGEINEVRRVYLDA